MTTEKGQKKTKQKERIYEIKVRKLEGKKRKMNEKVRE